MMGSGIPEETMTGTRRVLLAEDNPANRKLALAMLRKLGYAADAVTNGVEAVEAVGRAPYALVLMDCRMPEMDGFGATAEIRSREGPSDHIPIIAMTADAMEGDRERCLDAGMDDYLSKPVSFESLASLLERWIPSSGSEAGGASSPPIHPVAAPLSEASPVLDETIVSGLRKVGTYRGTDRISDLVSVFVSDAEANLRGLRTALEERDESSIRGRLHNLTGSAATFGAQRLAGLCAELKTRYGQEGPESLETALTGLEAELDRARAALRAEFPSAAKDDG